MASLIANETDLTKYHPTYDVGNQRISTPTYKVISQTPRIRKQTFAPEVDPSKLIDDEAEFEALNGIEWSSSTYQNAEQDKEVERVDPEASGQQEN